MTTRIKSTLLSCMLCMVIMAAAVSVSAVDALAEDTPSGLKSTTKQEIITRAKAYDEKTQDTASGVSVTTPFAAGTLNTASSDNALKTVNFYRYIAGLEDVSVNADDSAFAQAASLVSAINSSLTHEPTQPTGMDQTLFNQAKSGAQNSLLCNAAASDGTFPNLTHSVDQWIIDTATGGDNSLSHRRWLLNPAMQYTGFGHVNSYSAMYATDISRTGSVKYVTWPARYTPEEVLSGSELWSISFLDSALYNGLKEGTTYNVVLTKTAKDGTVSTQTVSGTLASGGYGGYKANEEKCLVFTPGSKYVSAGDKVSVSVQGLSAAFTYSVEIFSLSDNVTAASYKITATQGSNGKITPEGETTVTQDGSVVYTITPDTGYSIADVKVDGASIGAKTTYTFSKVTANHTIEASFSATTTNPTNPTTTYTVTTTCGENGSISPSGTVKVNAGATQTFKITPASGYVVEKTVVDKEDKGTADTVTFTNVSSNHTISVTFKKATATDNNNNTGNTNDTTKEPQITGQAKPSSAWTGWVSDKNMIGTTGKSIALDSLRLSVGSSGVTGGITYQTHMQTSGWGDWVSDGTVSGVVGKRMEAIRVKLTGTLAEKYDIYYRVHCQNYGWLDWAKNGDAAGTTGLSLRMEALQLELVTKGGKAPGSTAVAAVEKGKIPETALSYHAHYEGSGWGEWQTDDGMSTSVSDGRRLEAFAIKLTAGTQNGGITYAAHVQNIGWQSWALNGANIGTTGHFLRLEGVQIKLTGNIASQYDIYYCVQNEKAGWMGWAKNGESAGTEGYGQKITGLQVKLVKKGGTAPGNTGSAFLKKETPVK